MRALGVSLDAYSFPSLLKANGLLRKLCLGAEIHGLAVKLGEALKLFREMQKVGLERNAYTFVACEDYSFTKLDKEIHSSVLKSAQLLDVYVAGALVAIYVRCCKMSEAVITFNELDEKDKIAWNSMLTGFIQNCMYSEALHFFHDFRNAGQKPDQPDSVALISILSAASSLSALKNGKEIHSFIIRQGFILEGSLASSLVVMYSRCGIVENADKVFKSIQNKGLVLWTSMINAYGMHDHGKAAIDLFSKMKESLTPARGRCKDAQEIRMRMMERGLKKNPGYSWIEVGNRIHTFMGRDKSHPECLQISKKLDKITEKLEKKGGNVAQTKFVLHNVEENEKVKMLYGHSERLAIAYGLLKTAEGTPIRITKNLRVCGYCHTFCKLVSKTLWTGTSCEGCQ
ncbi:hypothetical protein REPUB_Repub12eG0112900 [Reevesia pubescens]